MNTVRTANRTSQMQPAARATATNPLWMITAALAVFAGVMTLLISTV